MKSKKVTRYYSDCGKGFWSKQKALTHEEYCKCWKNPIFKTCLSCKHKNFVKDSNGMENEPQYLQTWTENKCKNSEFGVPVHEDYEDIRKYCPHHELKIKTK